MMTFKLILGVVLVTLYLLAWAAVILLGLELAPRRLRGSTPSNTDEDRNHPGREKRVVPTPVINNDWGEEGARPSSLIPYYHHKPHRAYLLQLKYAVAKANEEVVRLYGPLPSGGLPVQTKTKPKELHRDPQGSGTPREQQIIQENEMNLKQVAAASILTVFGTLAAYRAGAAHENDKAIHALESGEIPQSRPALQSAHPTQSQSEAVREHLSLNSAVAEGFYLMRPFQ